MDLHRDNGGVMNFLDLDDDQQAAIAFMMDAEDSLICADVGTGKTVMALTAADNALECGDVTRWLVVAPLLVCLDTWASEASRWEHLAHLDVAVACGTDKERMRAVESGAPITVINYENLDWLMGQYRKKGKRDPLPFDGLICDEIDKLKNVSADRFKSFRNRIKVFKKRIGLTGTLIPKDLTDLWGQVYLVDNGETFGRSFYEWRKRYFYPTDFQQYNWAPFNSTRDLLLSALDGLAHRVEGRHLPCVEILPPTMLDLPDIVRDRYTALERDFYVKCEGHVIEAVNSGVLAGRLREMCAGFSYVNGDSSESKTAVWHSLTKFGWLDDLRSTIESRYGDEQLLIFYEFKEQLAELERRYPPALMGALGSGVPTKKKIATIERWNRGLLPMLSVHPQSAGHGLNLQKSGACHIAFLSLPWSGGLFRQAVGRLARRGQRKPVVYVHVPLLAGTIDNQVFNVVTHRLASMDSFLADLYDRQNAAQSGNTH